MTRKRVPRRAVSRPGATRDRHVRYTRASSRPSSRAREMAASRVTRASSRAQKKPSPNFVVGFAYLLARGRPTDSGAESTGETATQLTSKLLPFFINTLVARRLTPEEFGVPTVHFYLLSTESSLAHAWLILPFGGILSIAVPSAVLMTQNISLSTPYGQALMYYGAAAFIELCAEPHYIRAMRMSAFKLRLFAETASTVLRSVLTYALVSTNQSDVVLAFAYSQLAYATSMAAVYFAAAPRTKHANGAKDEATVKLIRIFSLQAVWKLILAEGEKAALIAVAAADEVGVYGLVASLGAAFARLARSTKEKEVFNALLRVAIIFGSTAAFMGPHFSWLALRILYGERWANQHFAAETLGFYSILLLPLAVNGITEAYAHAVMSSQELSSSNVWLLICSIVNVGGTLMLQRSMGPVSLLVANAMSMLVRIAFTGSYIRKRFSSTKVEGGVKLLSTTYLSALVIFSIIARISAQSLRSNPTTLALLAHVACGASILATLLIILYICERDAFLYLSKHDKGD